MTKNMIKKLAEVSYTKEKLDNKKVKRISRSLGREDLKVYIKDLKTMEAKKTVIVTVATDKGLTDIKSYFNKIYPSKRIVFTIDESLLTGIRVVDFDNIYELSLKNFLENAVGGSLND